MLQVLQRVGAYVSAPAGKRAMAAGGGANGAPRIDDRPAAIGPAGRGRDLAPAAPVPVRSPIELLALAAHELRGPLAPIGAAAAAMTLGGPEDLRRAQVIIQRQVAHMARMIDDLLELARGGTGKLRLQRETVELTEIVRCAVEACEPALARRDQRLDVHGPGGSCLLFADGVRVTQILVNLLDNASKYSPAGRAIVLEARRVERGVEIAVIDHGIGMAAAALEHAFEPFAQDDHAVAFNGSGLGIGLAVARELAWAHGGEVTASSAGLGHGSRFTVALPCAPRAPGA